MDAIPTYSILYSFVCRWQLNNIRLVLHNQTWRTRHVIVVPMKLILAFTLHSGLVSISCYAIPICPSTIDNFSIYLSPVFFCRLSAKVYTPFWSEVRNNDGLLGRIKHVYSSPLLPSSFFSMYIHACVYILTVTQ